MVCKEPSSMDELIYFTNRIIGSGNIRAWAYRILCPKCKKAKIRKPLNPKTGRPKVRSKVYECPECSAEFDKVDLEPLFTLDVKYKCPHCNFEGCQSIPYQRKRFKGVDAFVFNCEKCNEKIPITKKMSKPKKKKKK